MAEDVAYELPKYGWKTKLNRTFTEKRNQNISPRINQLPQFVGLGLRYLPWYIRLRLKKKRPIMDGLKPLILQQIYGVPLGGIGGGTIGRGFKGEFCRFQLFPGIYEHHVVKANTFIVSIKKNGSTVYQQVLSPRTPKKTLTSWTWGFPGKDAEFYGLYPRSWTVYHLRDLKVDLICRQISPVIPHNYKDSSLPVGVFVWEVINNSEEDIEISIALTFKNGTGSKKDKRGGRYNEPFSYSDDEVMGKIAAKGMMMHQKIRNIDCTVGIAALQKEGIETSYLNNFDPRGPGSKLWEDLKEKGHFDSVNECTGITVKGDEIACAVCAKTWVAAKSRQQLEMCLVWDMPKVVFPACPNVSFTRRYARWFGADGRAVPKLSHYALTNFKDWEQKIENWQKPILANETFPDWYKSAIFNELYFISDGGSFWIENTIAKEGQTAYANDVRHEFGKFAYLEGHEYKMFNTYDVHFYASFALVKLWPKLQISLQYDMADCIVAEDLESVKFLMDGEIHPRKTSNSIPHDIGDPQEGPWELINAYNIHDTAAWRDLNLKFVLQVYRDYVFLKDEDYLKNMWPRVQALMGKCLTWDADGDGLIENSGAADQTFDTWVMTGPSAYCGGLWLASLFATIKMASLLGYDQDANKYSEILEQGRKSYNEKLWTNEPGYYKFDCSTKSYANSIMADQLCGHWYLKSCGHDYEVFPKEKVQAALKTIFKFNVMSFKNGTMGAVNGIRPSGKLEQCTIQAEEVWTGVTYALASLMIREGMTKEGFKTAEGMYKAVYEQLGMAYQTPEALHPEKHCRSLGYMRPLSIWAIQDGLESLKFT